MKTTIGFVLLSLAAVSVSAACDLGVNTQKKLVTLLADCSMATSADKIVIPNGYTLDGNGHTATAVGQFTGAMVTNGGGNASVRNIILSTSGLPCSCHVGDDRLRGVYFSGASGDIGNVTVTDLNQGSCGCQEGNGIEVRNQPFDCSGSAPTRVTIHDSTVSRYQKNGLTCNGNAICTMRNNLVDGLEAVQYIAQNGIQYGFGASGKAQGNTVSGHWYTGAGWTATGILVFEASDVKVLNNTVVGNQVGMTAESWHWFCGNASDNQFSDNTVLESEWGCVIDAITFDGYSSGDAHADDNKLNGNMITNEATLGDTGIFVGVGDYGGGYDPVVCGNKVVGNSVSGFATTEDITENCEPEFSTLSSLSAGAGAQQARPSTP